MFVVFILRPVLQKTLPPAERRRVLKHASQRMQRFMNGVIVVQVLTGAMIAWPFFKGGWDMWTTLLGGILFWKIILVGGMLALYIVTPRLLISGKTHLGDRLHLLLVGLGLFVSFLGKLLA